MNEPLILRGMDGANPLAFLAAVGTLRSLTSAWPDQRVCLHWGREEGALRPLITSKKRVFEEDLITALTDQLRLLSGNPALALADDLSIDATRFRKATEAAQRDGHPTRRDAADFLSAFGCEALADTKTGRILDTALRTMSGAGHQHFLLFMRQLAADTSAEHLHAALFRPWRYTDPGPSLRWDPVDDRRHALRWDEPSGDPIRTVRGANALAVQSLPVFSTQPQARRLATTAMTHIPRNGTYLTWPIWNCPIPLDVVRSLLALKDIQDLTAARHIRDLRPLRARLASFGIVEIFRCQRITQGKYRNFTQAIPV